MGDEDEILLRHWTEYTAGNNKKKDSDELCGKIRIALNFGRTSGAIGTQLRKIIAEIEKRNESRQANEAMHADPQCHSRKQKVFSLFNKLIKYYHNEENQFDANNLERILKE